MNRRKAILGLAGLGLAGVVYRYWPEGGIRNPCPTDPLPESLANHELVQAAWDGLDPSLFRDAHVHLIGTGGSASGTWVNPDMQSLGHPIQWLQRVFYLNGSCTLDNGRSDLDYVDRLRRLLEQFPGGIKVLLLAFDWFHGRDGRRIPEASAFHTPDDWAASLAQQYPERFEWVASIHPYRPDAIDALEYAVERGARAVKWLPPAQGMDPGDPLCDPFYAAAAKLGVPLLVHSGAELAVHGGNTEDFGNPLRLRRPLEHGVRVIVAHCASLGKATDLDAGPDGPVTPCFDLFARMMDESQYEGYLFGELSAVTQINRFANGLDTLLVREEWHPRLLNGSDYPLPGILPLFSLKQLERHGYIQHDEVATLSAIRNYNPLLFDFVLKRTLRFKGKSFGPEPFQNRGFFLLSAPV